MITRTVRHSFTPARPDARPRMVPARLVRQGEAISVFRVSARAIDQESHLRIRIDELFLDHSTPEKAYRLETFRSAGSISATASQQLRCYFVTKCNFPIKAEAVPGEKTDIRQVSDPIFLEKATENTLEIYQKVGAHTGAHLSHVCISDFVTCSGDLERGEPIWASHGGV